MGEEIHFENGRFSNFQGLVTLTLTLTLDRVIRHRVVQHLSTSTYIANLIRIGKNFRGRTDIERAALLVDSVVVDLKSVTKMFSRFDRAHHECARRTVGLLQMLHIYMLL